jgi:hypothetical protein
MPTQAEQYARMMGGALAGSRPNARSQRSLMMGGLLDEAMVPPEMGRGMGVLTPSEMALWEEQDTGELNYGPDDPRIQPALVPGQYELVGPGGKRELVGERRQGRSITTGRPRQAGTETLRRGDQWQQPNQVASTSAILDQIREAVEAGLISPARAKELLMRLQGSMPPQ